MLFLYRPRQTWRPGARPMANTEQAAYARQLNDRFAATQRRPAVPPGGSRHEVVGALQDLAAMHRAGQLTDDEFARAKAQVLGG